MRRLLAAVGTAGLAAQGWAAPTAPVHPAADALVEKLSATRYADREAAGAALAKVGPAALPALDRAASAGGDAEIRERAARLADRIRKAEENAGLLAAPPVAFDYAAVPLAAAVADLKAKTGIPLQFSPDGVKNSLRLITVRAGPMPPWDAVAAFCKGAGVREVLSADTEAVGGTPLIEVNGRRRIAYSSMAAIPQPLAGTLPVLLADGPPDALPADRSTAVRVSALPAAFPGNRVVRGAGEVVLSLDVTPLPGLRWQEVTAVNVYRAEDDRGRPVAQSFRADPSPVPVNPWGHQVFFGGVGGNVMFTSDFNNGQQPAGRPDPRIVPVKLRTDDRPISRLRVFEGVVVGELSLPDQTLIAVPDLSAAVGKTFDGPSDARLTITGHEVREGPGGGLVVRLQVDGPNPWTMQRLGQRNRFAVMNTLPIVPGEGIALAAGLGQVKFADAAGKRVRPPNVTTSSLSDDGIRQTQTLELVFPKPGSAGSPTRLTVVGTKGVTVEVPFRLENVQLP